MEQNQVKSIRGTIFSIQSEITEAKYSSTTARGYIIVPDGEMVVVPTTRSHGDVFSEYLTGYTCSPVKMNLNGANASVVLAQYGHITYMSDADEVKSMMVGGSIKEVSALFDSYGAVSLPNDLESITKEQAIALEELIHSNINIMGNPRSVLKYGIISLGKDIEEQDVIKLLEAIKTEKKEDIKQTVDEIMASTIGNDVKEL